MPGVKEVTEKTKIKHKFREEQLSFASREKCVGQILFYNHSKC